MIDTNNENDPISITLPNDLLSFLEKEKTENNGLHLILGISMPNLVQQNTHYQTAAYFKVVINEIIILNKVGASIQKVTFVVADHLHRHNLGLEVALEQGDKWIKENQSQIERLENEVGIKTNLLRWRQWSEDPYFNPIMILINNLYAKDAKFKSIVNKLATQRVANLAKQVKKQGGKVPEKNAQEQRRRDSINYLLEDSSAAFWFLQLGAHFMIYPYKNNPAFQYILDLFIGILKTESKDMQPSQELQDLVREHIPTLHEIKELNPLKNTVKFFPYDFKRLEKSEIPQESAGDAIGLGLSGLNADLLTFSETLRSQVAKDIKDQAYKTIGLIRFFETMRSSESYLKSSSQQPVLLEFLKGRLSSAEKGTSQKKDEIILEVKFFLEKAKEYGYINEAQVEQIDSMISDISTSSQRPKRSSPKILSSLFSSRKQSPEPLKEETPEKKARHKLEKSSRSHALR